MPRLRSIVLSSALVALTLAVTAPSLALAGGNGAAKGRTASRWQRFKAGLKRIGRRVSVFVAPVRVSRTENGALKLVRYAVDKHGKIVAAEEITQFKNGLLKHSEITYKLRDGKRIEQREIERTRLLPGRKFLRRLHLDADGAARDGHAAKTAKTTKTVIENGKIKYRQTKRSDVKRLTPLRAYWKAVRESPIAEFAATTAVIFGALEFGLPAMGVHLSSIIGGWFGVSSSTGSIIGALAPKALTLPIIAAHALKKQRIHAERPKWMSKSVFKLMRKEADKYDEAKTAVTQAREVLTQPHLTAEQRRQANELVHQARDANHEALRIREQRQHVQATEQHTR